MIGLLLYAILARASAALIAPGVHGLAEKNTGKAAATVMPPRDCKAARSNVRTKTLRLRRP